jgi:hypothetical protein
MKQDPKEFDKWLEETGQAGLPLLCEICEKNEPDCHFDANGSSILMCFKCRGDRTEELKLVMCSRGHNMVASDIATDNGRPYPICEMCKQEWEEYSAP